MGKIVTLCLFVLCIVLQLCICIHACYVSLHICLCIRAYKLMEYVSVFVCDVNMDIHMFIYINVCRYYVLRGGKGSKHKFLDLFV